jgi:tetraacyldisaccharide 4'-kinase
MDDRRFRGWISGSTRGMTATLIRGGLRAASVAYRIGVTARNACFDRGLRRSTRVDIPVVSVGNITTGGTGKTPVVAFLANWFREQGRRPALLSRGYRSLDGMANDEKLVLDRLCPRVPHVQNPDRVAGARAAVSEHGADVLILDDGFQHRRLVRDLDIVLIDCLNPWGFGYLLPRGLLREPLSGLRRADLIALTRADLCPPAEKANVRARIAAIRGRDECVEVAFRPLGLVNATGATAALDAFGGRSVLGFCGIGNPDGFRQTLRQLGWDLVAGAFHSFPDHHHYTPSDLDHLGRSARETRADAVVTTLKDLVKLDQTELGGVPLWAVGIGVEVLSGSELLESALERVRERCRAVR